MKSINGIQDPRLLERANKIEADSIARLKQDDRDGELEAGLVMMVFEAAAGGVPPVNGDAAADGAGRKSAARG